MWVYFPGGFPIRSKAQLFLCISSPNFSPKTEPRLKCPSLECKYEKNPPPLNRPLSGKLKFSQNLVFKLLCSLLLVLCNQGHLPFTVTHDF